MITIAGRMFIDIDVGTEKFRGEIDEIQKSGENSWFVKLKSGEHRLVKDFDLLPTRITLLENFDHWIGKGESTEVNPDTSTKRMQVEMNLSVFIEPNKWLNPGTVIEVEEDPADKGFYRHEWMPGKFVIFRKDHARRIPV